jgi:hypothetical protein
MLMAPVALAGSKKECEAECDNNAKVCEDTMGKKLGNGQDRDSKAANGQMKKICGDVAKQCKQECNK